MSNPFISVIVPTYNRATLIAETLRSLQSQQYDNYEIIVVDDGSTDNTEEVVNSIADARTQYVRKQNGERAVARNFGAAMAKGAYVNFFDSDDIALSNHLSKAAELIAEHKMPEWFHLGFAWANSNKEIFKRVDNYSGETLNHIIHQGNPFGCNDVFVRKDIFLMHKFNEDRKLTASEDYELWLRLAARYPLYYSNEITSMLIDHAERSVRNVKADVLITRLRSLVHYINADEIARKYYGSKLKSIEMDCDSYISLHLSEVAKYKGLSTKYLFKAIGDSPAIFGNRRFLAIVRNLLFRW
ncbi:MAG: glycosyltransferase family 2 protein [Sphingobacteriales bacterium]|nr:MAG: glycosyltransferase family 2 protein [Sphingobacteriales bacterium]